MKASRFSDAQRAFILKQGAEGIPVADICRRAGISQATYFNWKKKCDGMLPPGLPITPTSRRSTDASGPSARTPTGS